MTINIDNKFINNLLIAILCLILFEPVMNNIVVPVFSFIGKILSSLYKVVSAPIRKLCVVFDKWNKNPPKKDFESF